MKADAMSRRCLAANALALLAVPNRDAFAAGLRPALGPGRFRATRFEGEYSDLLHPLCDRKIAVDTSALKQSGGGDYFLATFSGNDIGPPGEARHPPPSRGYCDKHMKGCAAPCMSLKPSSRDMLLFASTRATPLGRLWERVALPLAVLSVARCEICSQYRCRQCRQGLLRRGERLPVRAARLELRGAHLA